MDENQTLQDFLKDIPDQDKSESDLFSQELSGTTEEVDSTAAPEKDSEPYKNRRHRRLEAQLQTEREARIRAEALAEARSETQKFAQETGVDERLLEMYGNTDEGKRAARLHQELLADTLAKGRAEALKEIRAEQERATQEQANYESVIDSELEALEDEFNIDITSDAPAARKLRRDFLARVEKLSPKDASGTITGFADFGGVWETFQGEREKPDNSRAKDLADRSMAKSGSVDTSQATEDVNLAWLRRNGINV